MFCFRIFSRLSLGKADENNENLPSIVTDDSEQDSNRLCGEFKSDALSLFCSYLYIHARRCEVRVYFFSTTGARNSVCTNNI
jgi:hypothetical protein